MNVLTRYPRLTETLISLGILVGSYLAARFLSFLFAKALTGVAKRTAGFLDDRLVESLRGPVTLVLFVAGAYVALHRLPLPERWISRLDGLLFALCVLAVALTLVRSYGRALHWYTTRSALALGDGPVREFAPLLSKVGKIFIALVALITVLQHFEVDVKSLVVSLGVVSLAVGLAAQETLANMIAGFTLMLDRPFRIGDRIQLASGEVGDVEAIGMRATRIRTPDDTVVVVPNSVLVKERLINQSRPTRHIAIRIEVRVAYGTGLEAVKKILSEAALASELVDGGREPEVLVTRFGDFSVNFAVTFWARDYEQQGAARSQVHEEIYRRLAEAKIEIPLPTSRVIHEEEPLLPSSPEEA